MGFEINRVNSGLTGATPSPGSAGPSAAPTAPASGSGGDTWTASGNTKSALPPSLASMQQDLARVIAAADHEKPGPQARYERADMLRAIYSPAWVFNTAIDQPPREAHGAADKLTRKPDGLAPQGSTPETRLIKALEASPGSLQPADVMRLSLAVNGNDYFLASLTAHNVLKNATATERRVRAGREESPQLVAQDRAVTAKLADLRAPNDPDAADKMGPWYHIFGLATLDAANHWALPGPGANEVDELAMGIEHQDFLKPKAWHRIGAFVRLIGFDTPPARKLAHWLESRHPLNGADPGKAKLDQMAVVAFAQADRLRPQDIV